MQNNGNILDSLMGSVGLYEKIFGKVFDLMIYDKNTDFHINRLKHLEGYLDVENIFKRSIDKSELKDINKIVFRTQKENINRNNENK